VFEGSSAPIGDDSRAHVAPPARWRAGGRAAGRDPEACETASPPFHARAGPPPRGSPWRAGPGSSKAGGVPMW